MKQENLDEIRNIYLGLVTGGEGSEVLNEAPGGKAQFWDSNMGRFVTGVSNNAKSFGNYLAPPASSSANPSVRDAAAAKPVKPVKPVKPKPFEYNRKNLGDKQNAEFRAGGGNASVGDSYTVVDVVARGKEALKAKAKAASRNNSSDNNSSGNGSGGSPSTAPRPTPSGPVLSKKDGVEGTGVGADFKSRAFTGAEKTRYSTVAAQNAARTSTSTGTSTKPVAPVGDKFGTSSIKPQSSTEVKSSTPTIQFPKMPLTSPDNTSSSSSGSSSPEGETDRLKKALDIKKSDVNSSYQWPSAKTIRDIAGAYASIYEAKKKVDQDQDGDNDFADNMIARMIASGMSREEAIKKVKNKDYNKKDELDEGIGSAIRGLFGKSKPKPSRGEELRSKYGSPARFGRPSRTPSGEKTKTRYDITLNSSGQEAADKVHGAALNMLGVAPRDTGSHKPGTVTSGNYPGEGNSANRRMGNPPEDTRDRVESPVKRGHINSRGVRKPLARSINADFEMWVDGLLNEGYDLSDYTWDEMADIYLDEATAMSKHGLDEPEIRKQIASKTKGGSFADKATALADRPTYGDYKMKAGREKLARKQRGDFRDTTSSNPGLHGYAYKATTDADKEKQAARGKQRGVLTPNEKKQLNREAYKAYEFVASYLVENNFASTIGDANVIINNMSENWFNQIMQG